MVTQSESQRYIAAVTRRWWLIALAVVLAMAASYYLSQQQPQSYTAQARLFIGNIDDPNPNPGTLETGTRLAQTYAQLTNRFDIMSAVIDELDLSLSVEDLIGRVSSSVVRDTAILTVSVTDVDSQRAADTANAVARQLIQYSPTNLTEEQLTSIEQQRDLLDNISRQLNDAQIQALLLNDRIAEEDDPDDLEELILERDRLNQQIRDDQASFVALTASYNALVERANKLELVDPARPPLEAGGLSTIISTLAGGIVGGILATALILFSEYANAPLRTEAEARRALDLPLLGTVGRASRQVANHANYQPDNALARSPIIEDYRKIQTNLLFSAERPRQDGVFLMSSPDRDDGRTFTLANLAVVAAETGFRVLLIDADLRAPRQHDHFGLDNDSGLALLLDLVRSNPDAPLFDSAERMKQALQDNIRPTSVPRLDIMTSGTGGIGPSGLLGFDGLDRWMEVLRNHFQYDVILLDSPSALDVADSYVLAAKSEAQILLLALAGRTDPGDAIKCRDQFQYIGSTISGVILNRV